MRQVVAAAIAVTLATGLASAQMKVTQQTPAGTATAATSAAMQQTAQTGEQSLESARRITRQEAMKLVKAGKAVYVDVRSKEQYDLGHIKGAISIPGSQIIARFKEIPPRKMIIAYCA